MRTFPGRRGISLLAVLIVLAVLMVLVAAAISFTGQELASSAHYKRREVMAACANGARNYVMSRLAVGANGRANNTRISGEWVAGDLLIRTGHLDESADGGSFPSAVVPCPAGLASNAMSDLTNTTVGPGGAIGRQCLRVIAHCLDTKNGDQTEVEFLMTLAL